MKPNIFIDRSNCPEDFFSHALAYILELFPALGNQLVNRIEALAGKRPGYFGQFKQCEFVAREFPQDHKASKPDLRLVCSTRIIYFENKLDSPLSIVQMQRHGDLTRNKRKKHLLFVSNISHKRPDLRSIPGYLHPQRRDHFLWLDLLPALESHHRKASLAARILDDFRAALDFHGMVGREIKGATGSLYTSQSKANHHALSLLSQTLLDVGFIVSRKQARETTLRVYPSRHCEHPLLNPRFYASAAWLDSALDFECLVITALSRPKLPRLSRYLDQFPVRRDCRFVPASFQYDDGYFLHGDFVLPVKFSNARGPASIDFPVLTRPLRRIHKFLTGLY